MTTVVRRNTPNKAAKTTAVLAEPLLPSSVALSLVGVLLLPLPGIIIDFSAVVVEVEVEVVVVVVVVVVLVLVVVMVKVVVITVVVVIVVAAVIVVAEARISRIRAAPFSQLASLVHINCWKKKKGKGG